MSYRIQLLLGLLFLLFFTYLLYLNPEAVSLQLGGGLQARATLPFFILIAFVAGGAGILSFFLLDLLARSRVRRREKKKLKKQLKAGDLCRQGLEKWYAAEKAKAAKLFQKALRQEPRHLEARQALVRLYLEAGEVEPARETVEAGLQLEPENVRLHWLRAEVLEQAGEPALLAAQLARLAKRYPDNQDLLRRLATACMAVPSWAEALDAWLRLAKKMGKKDRERLQAVREAANNCRYELARQQWRQGELEDSRRTLKELLGEDPTYVAAYLLEAEMIVAAGDEPKRLAEAVAVLVKGYKKQPNVRLLQESERLLQPQGGGDVREKINKFYRQMVAKAYGYWPARLLYAVFCLENQELEQAGKLVAELEQQVVGNPLVEMVAAELEYRRSRELNKVVDRFKQAVGFGDQLPLVYRCRHCRRFAPRWVDRCPACGRYNTYDLAPVVVTPLEE
ncbi:MAG: tetratricopeptide repeat protein [Deltaproteobacteria bacterium]|nr:tetratricopeptide repeat protein [Deltaproteobacteria bacterium]